MSRDFVKKNISKIISIFFLIFSTLLLCYVFYRSQIVHSGARLDYYLKYYLIAFLSITLSFISFFIPNNLKINVTIVGMSTLIGLYLVEGYLVILHNPGLKSDNFLIYKNNTGKDYDKRNRYRVYLDLKREDPNIITIIHPSHFINDQNLSYFPLSGLPNRKTIHCNENGYYSIFQSDRQGFNNPDKEWDKDEIEFLLIGDSFTHGACVNEPDTISGNLRKLNNNKDGILNLGQSGNGPLIEYATLREYLPVKQVKRVLWIYYENDLMDLYDELNNQILVSYLKDNNFSQNIILRNQEMEKILLEKFEHYKFATLTQLIKLYSVRKKIFSIFGHDSISKPDSITTHTSAHLEKFKSILKLSNKLTKENNSKLYFIYLPKYNRYIDGGNNGQLHSYNKIIKLVQSLDIPVIDINKKLFEKYDDPLSLFSFKMVHYTEKSNQLIAKIIFSKIQEYENIK